MFSRFLLLGCLLISALGGCVVLSDELQALKDVGKSQVQINAYVRKQERRFLKLLKHYKRGWLRVGIAKSKIIAAFGEPVLVKNLDDNLAKEVFLYRHPTNYFKSDKIYLYFDKLDKLVRWEYRSYISQQTSKSNRNSLLD